MSRKLILALVVGLAGSASAAAFAASGAPSRVTISTRGSAPTYKINRYAQFGLRWAKDVYTVKSGGTLVFNNTVSDPHTFSIFKPGQRPRTAAQINACSAEPPALPKLAPCRTLVEAHAPSGPEAPPKNPVLNTGKPGIDGPGDSVFIPPKGAPQPSIKVTAKPGTTLYFVCLVHPWMQGKLIVK